jgi:predicted permease
MKPLHGLRSLFGRARLDREMDAELRFHLDEQTRRNLAAGMTPDEAARAARQQFGWADRIREEGREARGWMWLDDLMRDVRHAARSLRKSPVFTAVAVISLALGIGAGTAVFSLLNAVLLRSLPVPNPHELRIVNWRGLNPQLNSYTGSGVGEVRGGFRAGSSFPYPAYREFRDRGTGFSAVFAFFPLPRITVLGRSEATTADGLMVSGNFFATYGASMLIGRPLTLEDDRPEAAPVAVITHRMWEQQFGLDPHVIGQTISINQNIFTIVGVLSRNHVGPLPGDSAVFYVPFSAQPALVPSRPLDSANRWWVQIMARLAPEADETQAQAALAVLFRQILANSNTRMDQPDILLEDGGCGAGTLMRSRAAQPLLALLAVVGVVLAIACANVAGLLLARGAARQHEFAVRAAMGAGRWRLIRQSITESLLIALIAACGALLVASWGKTALLQSFGGIPASFRFDTRADAAVLAFALGVSVITALVFGLLPALRASHADPLTGLKNRTAVAAPRLRLGRVLVATQAGLAVLLVVGAGLMIRTFVNLVRVDLGFDPENVLVFRLNPGQAGYKDAALAGFYAEARRSIAAIPGVRSVALSSMALTANSSSVTDIEIPGRPAQAGESLQTSLLSVSDGFLATMGIPLLQGCDIAASDTADSAPVAVVNETFARTFFSDESPLGRTFVLQDGRKRSYTIVGITRDAKYANIRDAVPPVAYFSSQQQSSGVSYFVIRSVLPPVSLVPAARKAIAVLNPNLPLSSVQTQEEHVDQSVSLDRVLAGLCGGLAGLALLLACIGLYGLMAYNVARRTPEIGVRMALGATSRLVAWSIVREALLLAGAGLAVGIPCAFGIARVIKSQLFGIAPADPLAFAVGVVLLISVTVLAAWLPARRAARVDPLTALRAE